MVSGAETNTMKESNFGRKEFIWRTSNILSLRKPEKELELGT